MKYNIHITQTSKTKNIKPINCINEYRSFVKTSKECKPHVSEYTAKLRQSTNKQKVFQQSRVRLTKKLNK